MTDAEINRKVAEACGYAVEMFYGHTTVNGQQKLWDPRHDANQAIEALDRVFTRGWEVMRFFSQDDNLQFNVRGCGDSFAGRKEAWEPTFCLAACSAILATLAPASRSLTGDAPDAVVDES